MREINILLADDHFLIIESLTSILAKLKYCNVILNANTKDEVFDQLKKENIHVIFLDLNMNGVNTLNHVEKIKEEYPKLKIVILTSYDSQNFISEAISKNVDAYLLKNSDESEILFGLEAVLKGEKYMNIGQPKAFSSKDNFQIISTLTDRELEIIKCLSGGKTNNFISEKLFISITTIQTHRKNIYKKLGLNTVNELISFAYRNNLT